MGGLGIVAVYGLVMVASLALAVYLPAALARAALRGTVSDGFAWREILGFIKANLGNYLLSLVIYLLASFVSQFGIILCCVGDLPGGLLGLHGPGGGPRPDRPPQPRADLSTGWRAQRIHSASERGVCRAGDA